MATLFKSGSYAYIGDDALTSSPPNAPTPQRKITDRAGRTVFAGVFGDLATATRDDQITEQFQYNIGSGSYGTLVVTGSNGGTVTQSNSQAVVASSVATNGFAQIQSEHTNRYRPGHEAYAFFTAEFTDTTGGAIQRIGLFDDDDGFYVAVSGSTFVAGRRHSGTDTIYEQSAFSIDALDGTGPSAFVYDKTKNNVFRISFGWLGAAPATFEILKPEGEWLPFHKVLHANLETGTTIGNPILPIRAEVIKDAGATDVVLRTASWNAGIYGTFEQVGDRSWTVAASGSVSANTETVALVVNNKDTFQSKTNKAKVHLG